MKDYYYILGIKRNATPIEIRAAYRKLSKKFHPDLNSGDKFFEERFKEIQEAYEILIDSLKREKYDESFEKEKIYPNYNYSKSESRSTYESKYKSYKTNSSNGNDKVKSSNNLYILISIVSVFVLSIYIISFNTDSQKEAKSSSETSIQKQELNNSNIQSHLNDKTSKTFEKNNEEKLILSPYQRKLKPKDLFGYCLKIYGYDYNTKDFLVNYLETFDRDYNNYKRNEFILESKINEALSEISNLLDSIEYTNIFFEDIESEFGEYDFNTESFDFLPFTNMGVRLENKRSKNVFNRYNFFRNAKIKGADNRTSDRYIINFDDFEGLKLEKNDASKLVERKSTENFNKIRVDRRLYLRVYYSIIKNKLQFGSGNYVEDSGIYCYVYKVEVWEDKNMSNKLLSVLDAKTNPPDYLQDLKKTFDKDFALAATK